MSALEDIKLEETRSVLGALVLLTKNSSPVNYQRFNEINALGGALHLSEKGYAVKNNFGNYYLTVKGWVYARRVLDLVGKTL